MSLLEYNYSILGTWPLALTAYNHGAGGMRRAVRETGTTDIQTIIADYRGRLFGFASRNFYAQFLAVLQIENDLDHYFAGYTFDPAPQFREVRVDGFVESRALAETLGVSHARLQADNPALRAAVWDGDKRIPRGYPVKLHAGEVPPGDLLALVPDSLKFSEQTPDVEHIVARGESLSVIARRYDTSVSRLVALNQLTNRHRIQIGQRLLLPQGSEQAVAAAPPESAAPEPAPAAPAPDPESEPPPEPVQIASNEPVRIEEPISSGEPILPPAAVLPDDQELDAPVSGEDELAEAIDPILDVAQSNRILNAELAADPSDYDVDSGNTIEVQAEETLGHYADWLGIRAQDLRRINNMAFRDPVIVGERLRLDFSQVNVAGFERARRAYHAGLQQEFFGNYHIQGVINHTVAANENISTLASNRYLTPIWLLRQYNPGLDMNRLQIGQEIVFPRLQPVQ